MIARTEFLRTPHDAPPELLLMLTAYLDESGQESPEHTIVGGFIGNDEQWTRVSADWRVALGNRKGLHMNRLRWNGRSAARTRLLMERVAPIPNACGLVPVWSSVRISDYADLIGETIFARTLSAGYIVAAQSTLLNILIWAILKGKRVKVVFEEQERFRFLMKPIAEFQAAFATRMMAKENLPVLSGVEYVTKTTLTEPADCLVFTALNRLRNPNSHKATWCAPIMHAKFALSYDMPRDVVRQLFSSPAYLDICETGRQMESVLRKAQRDTHERRLRSEQGKTKK